MPDASPDLVLIFPGGTATGMATVENCERLWDFLPFTLRCQLAAAHYTPTSFAHALLREWRTAATPDGGPVRLEIHTRPTGLFLATHPTQRGLARRDVPLFLADLYLVCLRRAFAVRFPGHVGTAHVWSLLLEDERADLMRLGVTPAGFNRAIVECWLEAATMADSTTIPVVRVITEAGGMRVAAGGLEDLAPFGGGAYAV